MTLKKRESQDAAFFADAIVGFAEELNIKVVTKSKSLVRIRFHSRGRSQDVDITLMGYDYKKRLIVSICSPAMVVVQKRELALQSALQLLRENSSMMHGAWAIQERAGKSYLVVQDTVILDTLDLDEFEASVLTVAAEADRFERKMGRDSY